MKRLVWLLVAFSIAVFTGMAQQQIPSVPVDQAVRTGKLDNGLTYYIRQNALPENQAYFYIVQKVGSMQEEESQRGLAHFLEHMAFNGTRHFPNDETGPGIIPYLESIGVKYGRNLNAGTSFDYTIYNIDAVPAARQSTLDSCLLILHDWSGFLLLRDKDVEKERKIIHEEWRTRQNMSIRMMETLLPDIYAGTRYANRLPIGLMEVVDYFEPKVLRDYYHTWYRPDLQGIIIVGDIDVDKTEAQLKALFSDIAKPVNPKERVYDQVTDNEDPIVSIATDKENPNSQVILFYKRDIVSADKKAGMDYLVHDFMSDLVQQMLTSRLEELMQQANAPYAYAAAEDGAYLVAQSKDALTLFAMAHPGGSRKAIETLIREANRVRTFGFTAGEFERAKAEYLSRLEKLYNERDKQRSAYYVDQYVDHFLKNEPIPGIADLYTTMQQVAPYIPLEGVNQVVRSMITDRNRVLAIMGSDKETYPSKDEIKAIFKQVDAEEITAYVDNAVTEPLMASLPPNGQIVSEKQEKGATVWTLSNGATVVVKPTAFKDDEVLISGYAPGGTSLIGNEHVAEIKVMGKDFYQNIGESSLAAGGLGKFSATDLKKLLAGKNVSMQFHVDAFNEEIEGRSTVRDLETALQLFYLNFTDVRKDETAYASFVTRNVGMLSNIGSNPMVVFSDSVMSAAYSNNPRVRFITAADVEKADYETMLLLYKERFANAGAFVFTIVGNVNLDSLKPMVEQYMASLPSTSGKADFNKKALVMRKGAFVNHFTRELETPKATTGIIYSGKLAYNLQNAIQLDALKQILDILFNETIREKLGGTYGVQVISSLDKTPSDQFYVQTFFDTDPERQMELVNAINAIIDKLMTAGPSAANVQKAKEFMTKEHADNLKRNEYALTVLNNQYRFGTDYETNYQQYVDQLSEQSLKKFAKQLFGQKNRVEVSMSSK